MDGILGGQCSGDGPRTQAHSEGQGQSAECRRGRSTLATGLVAGSSSPGHTIEVHPDWTEAWTRGYCTGAVIGILDQMLAVDPSVMKVDVVHAAERVAIQCRVRADYNSEAAAKLAVVAKRLQDVCVHFDSLHASSFNIMVGHVRMRRIICDLEDATETALLADFNTDDRSFSSATANAGAGMRRPQDSVRRAP